MTQSVLGWLLPVLYLTGFLVTWRHIGGRIAWESGRPDGCDIFAGIIFGGAAAIPWPVSLPIAMLTERGADPGSKAAAALGCLLRTPARVRLKEAKAREDEQARRIAQLEREVGIGRQA